MLHRTKKSATFATVTSKRNENDEEIIAFSAVGGLSDTGLRSAPVRRTAEVSSRRRRRPDALGLPVALLPPVYQRRLPAADR